MTKNRIKELRTIRAGDLKPDPRNARKHTDRQRQGLAQVLERVGFAGAVIAREVPAPDGGPATFMLVDGHLRAGMDPEEQLPVLIVDLNDEEAAAVMATYDAVGSMAEWDADLYGDLVQGLETFGASVEDGGDGLAFEGDFIEDLRDMGGLGNVELEVELQGKKNDEGFLSTYPDAVTDPVSEADLVKVWTLHVPRELYDAAVERCRRLCQAHDIPENQAGRMVAMALEYLEGAEALIDGADLEGGGDPAPTGGDPGAAPEGVPAP